MTDIWHLDGHTLSLTLDRDSTGGRFACEIDTSGRAGTLADPCRVDYDEDGQPTGKLLDSCNFLQWSEEFTPWDIFEILDRDVRNAPVGALPLAVAFRWDADGYVWAPRDWAKDRTDTPRDVSESALRAELARLTSARQDAAHAEGAGVLRLLGCLAAKVVHGIPGLSGVGRLDVECFMSGGGLGNVTGFPEPVCDRIFAGLQASDDVADLFSELHELGLIPEGGEITLTLPIADATKGRP